MAQALSQTPGRCWRGVQGKPERRPRAAAPGTRNWDVDGAPELHAGTEGTHRPRAGPAAAWRPHRAHNLGRRHGDPIGPAAGGCGAAPEGLPQGRYLSDGVSEEDDAGPEQEPPAGARLRQRHDRCRRRTSASSGGRRRPRRFLCGGKRGGRGWGGRPPFRSALKTGFKFQHRQCFIASPRL